MLDFNEDVIGRSKYFPAKPIFFKQLSICEILIIPENKPDIEHIISAVVQPKIVSMRIVDTVVGFSYEGQNLTGKQLIIEFELIEKIKYVADKPKQSVHAAHFEKKYKSIFVTIPSKINSINVEDLLESKKIIVKSYIEDIHAKKLDKRRVYKNITMLIDIIFYYIKDDNICADRKEDCICIE